MKVSIGFLVTATEMHNRNIATRVSEREKGLARREEVAFCLSGLSGSIKLFSLEQRGSRLVLDACAHTNAENKAFAAYGEIQHKNQ